MEAITRIHEDHQDDADITLPRLGETLIELLLTVGGFAGAIMLIFAALRAIGYGA
jgi:hypothetical protein